MVTAKSTILYKAPHMDSIRDLVHSIVNASNTVKPNEFPGFVSIQINAYLKINGVDSFYLADQIGEHMNDQVYAGDPKRRAVSDGQRDDIEKVILSAFGGA